MFKVEIDIVDVELAKVDAAKAGLTLTVVDFENSAFVAQLEGEESKVRALLIAWCYDIDEEVTIL